MYLVTALQVIYCVYCALISLASLSRLLREPEKNDSEEKPDADRPHDLHKPMFAILFFLHFTGLVAMISWLWA